MLDGLLATPELEEATSVTRDSCYLGVLVSSGKQKQALGRYSEDTTNLQCLQEWLGRRCEEHRQFPWIRSVLSVRSANGHTQDDREWIASRNVSMATTES